MPDATHVSVQLKPVRERPSLSDGVRVLVEHAWPPGVPRKAVDVWLPQLAPSATLRKWFRGQPEYWSVFRRRYLKELCEEQASHAFEQLYKLAEQKRTVTLVFAAAHGEHTPAAILRDLIEGTRKPPSSSGPARVAAAHGRVRMSRPR